MKKLAGVIIAMLLAALSISALSESVTYEAEEAAFSGKVSIFADAAASGCKAVGRFESNDDVIDFAIAVPEDGIYDLVFVCKGIGGGKTNRATVDGMPQGEFTCAGEAYEACTVRSVWMTAGSHNVIFHDDASFACFCGSQTTFSMAQEAFFRRFFLLTPS